MKKRNLVFLLFVVDFSLTKDYACIAGMLRFQEVMFMTTHNQKHLTLDDRITIKEGIIKTLTLKSIAKSINKDPTTIKKEIVRHRVFKPGNHLGEQSSFTCENNSSCSSPNKNISTFCNPSCTDFKFKFCKRRDKSPFSCNGCSKKSCRKDKFYYDASIAQKKYEETLVDSRAGVDLTYSEALRISDIVRPLILHGQSPAQILMGHPELNVCEKTIYNYIDDGILPNINNLDLRKKVAYSPRKSKVHPYLFDKKYLIGRKYEDFIFFVNLNPFTPIVELDSVEGSRDGDGKVLHTMLFINQNFLIAYLSAENTANSTIAWFDFLHKKLNSINFMKFFPLILTDRGKEFSNPDMLEIDSNGIQRTHVFYCDAMHSWDKGALENAHHYVRYILPKGTKFNDLTQSKVDLMLSHINNSPRESLNGKSPYECMDFFYGDLLMKKLNIKKIDNDDIILTPTLLK